ncbi:hypothetical protein SBOR_0776 [Sclerotinia borealis F-4128]|uniref:Uncharacterized protein n=1 Tax=Sclerotinia borealis (strain F-4128) TaxID=1432307 RepID=W9CS38_SCLBF|nr:hypothetical protein SBOR_0776 [Sclerotinia borealis F-4128]
MASFQPHYTSLSTHLQRTQDTWVHTLLTLPSSTACIQSNLWLHHDSPWFTGYICSQGHHAITDELISEGKGGCYGYSEYEGGGPLVGPWYRADDWEETGIWVYGGEDMPRGTVNSVEVRERWGEFCGIGAVGWVERDVYRVEGVRWRTQWEGVY